jgi:parallel beta-helix repeat protein
MLALVLVLPAGWAVAETLGGRGGTAADATSSTPPTDAACGAAPGQVSAAVQRYVDRFAGMTGFEDRRLPAPPQAREVDHEFAVVRRDLRRHQCPLPAFGRRLAGKLDTVRARGPLARAVAGMLRTDALRATGSGDGSAVRTVSPGTDLAAAVAAASPGATVRLAPGEYHLADPLYVLQDLRLVGSGPGRTRILSSAAGAAAVVPGGGDLRLSGLTVRHVGTGPASVLAVWGGDVRVARVQLGGAVVDRHDTQISARARGGSGVMASGDGRLDITRSQLRDNDVAGLLAGGSVRTSLTRTRITGNAMCGACFVDRASGDVRRSRIDANRGLGIAVYGASRPRVVDNVVSRSGQAGLLVNGSTGARALVRDNRLTGNREADIVVAGRGHSAVSGNRCSSSAGIVVVGAVTPELSGNECAVHHQS